MKVSGSEHETLRKVLMAKAVAFAAEVHAEQSDNADEPYILHPLRVMLLFDDTLRRTVAVLHDVIEDCNVSRNELARLFGAEVADLVDVLSLRENEKYFDYIERVAANPVAASVKLGDLHDNLRPERLRNISIGQQKKYEIARERLRRITEPTGAL